MNDPLGLEASGLPPELVAQLMGSSKRRAIAEAMLRQAMQAPEVQQPKGRFQGVVSPLEHIAKLTQGVLARGDMRAADDERAAIGRQAESGRKAAMEAYMKQKLGAPEVAYTDTLGSEPPQAPISPGVKADPRGALAAGFADPYLKDSKFLQMEQGSLDKAEAREDQQAQRRWELEMQARSKLEQIREAAAEGRITKEEADRRHEALMRQLAADKADLSRELAANRPRPQPTPITDAAGNVTWWLDAQPVATAKGAGKPSATFEKAQTERTKMVGDLNSAIEELESATKDGGLIDQSTGSGAGAVIDAVAGFFGKATPGAVAAGRMAPIFDKVLKMVPRFEGPQSDKDTQSYKEAAGQLANPAVPTPQKKAAAKEILRLMKARRGQFVGADSGAPAGGVSVFDAADAIIKSNGQS